MPGIVHFDIPVEDLDRARAFYSGLFSWRIEKVPGDLTYYMISTEQGDGQPGLAGGMALRDHPGQQITNFVGVDDLDEAMAEVERLGGKVLEGKTPIVGFGYLAVCQDTEQNTFGLWMDDNQASMP